MSHEEENGKSRINWNTFFAGTGVLISIGGAAVYAIIAPFKAEIDSLRQRIETMEQHHSALLESEREMVDMKIKASVEVENARLVEIETQFRASDQSRNVQFATQQRIDAMLWEKVWGSRYPSDAVFYPSIAK